MYCPDLVIEWRLSLYNVLCNLPPNLDVAPFMPSHFSRHRVNLAGKEELAGRDVRQRFPRSC